MKNLPEAQQKQAEGVMANAQAGAGALAGTAGGAVKGVADTAGNTVYLLLAQRTQSCIHHATRIRSTILGLTESRSARWVVDWLAQSAASQMA